MKSPVLVGRYYHYEESSSQLGSFPGFLSFDQIACYVLSFVALDP